MEPDSGSIVRRYGWSVAVVISASAFFLVAFFLTGFVLDDNDDGSLPALMSADAGDAPAQATEGDATGEAEQPAAVASTSIPAVTPNGDFTTTVLPAFDPETLLYGGEGVDGAILAGLGIVPSSGFDRRTDWELIVPSAQLRAAIVRLGVTATNLLGAPDNPHVIGWWSDGPAPGEAGNVLLDGHRDFADVNDNVGQGVCWLLTETRPGHPLIIRDRTDGSAFVYTVREIHSVNWDDPAGGAFLRSSNDAVLTLITCEGSFDAVAHNYLQRRVVIADLTDRVAPSSIGTE